MKMCGRQQYYTNVYLVNWILNKFRTNGDYWIFKKINFQVCFESLNSLPPYTCLLNLSLKVYKFTAEWSLCLWMYFGMSFDFSSGEKPFET